MIFLSSRFRAICPAGDKGESNRLGNSLWELDIKGTDDLVDIKVIAGGGDDAPAMMDGRTDTVWKSEAVDRAELLLDLRRSRTISGLRIDWDQHYAGSVDMAISPDGKEWKQVSHISVSEAQGQTDFLPHEASEVRYIRLVLADPITAGGGFGIGDISLRGPTEAFTPFVQYQFNARKAPFGDYPPHLRDSRPTGPWSAFQGIARKAFLMSMAIWNSGATAPY